MIVDVETQIAAYGRWIEHRVGAPMSPSAATPPATSTRSSSLWAREPASDELVVGPEAGEASRPHLRRWLAIAACIALALGGLVLLFGRSTSGPVVPARPPSEPPTVTTGPGTVPSTETVSSADQESAATRTLDPDADPATPLRVEYRVPSGWTSSWFGSVKYLPGNADGITGLSITTVSNVVTDGCRDHTPLEPPIGSTVDDLAVALSRLAPFEVTSPPTDVTIFGYRGKHLQLTVPALTMAGAGEASFSKNTAQFTDCADGELYSWISPINDLSPTLLGHSGDSHGAFNAYQAPGQTEDFWILDVEGSRLVLVSFDTPGAPTADVEERDAIFASIRIEP